MILVIYNETEILNVVEAPENGVTHTTHQLFTGSIADAKAFFQDVKQFNIQKITDYETSQPTS